MRGLGEALRTPSAGRDPGGVNRCGAQAAPAARGDATAAGSGIRPCKGFCGAVLAFSERSVLLSSL